jgi:hypothetical protein
MKGTQRRATASPLPPAISLIVHGLTISRFFKADRLKKLLADS